MKTIYLLRHAKSSWKDDELSDRDRPLKHKGHFQAEMMSSHLSTLLPAPQKVLCSPARRTRETFAYFQQAWNLKPAQVHFEPSLYLAVWKDLFQAVQSLSGSKEILMLVGHNPGLTDFARKLLCAESEELETLRTCAFLQFDFEVASWKEITPHTGRLKLTLRPKDLER
ncbi:MAG: SixA phosphatase family protein [Kiritimatiellia bacterium]